jgi:hypothetical protein
MLSIKIARIATRVKGLLLIAALGAFLPAALAAEPNCRMIESTGPCLACYDAAFPPPKSKTTEANVDAPPSEYNGPFITEEARTAAKLKNICRDC